jgi:hypothetical protein
MALIAVEDKDPSLSCSLRAQRKQVARPGCLGVQGCPICELEDSLQASAAHQHLQAGGG